MALQPKEIQVGDVIKISYTFTFEHNGEKITKNETLSARVQVIKTSEVDNSRSYAEVRLEEVRGILSHREGSWNWYDFTHFQHKVIEVKKL